MTLVEINEKLSEVGVKLDKNYTEYGYEVTAISKPTNIEGLYKIISVTLKNLLTGDVSNQVIWSQPLKNVCVPIILNNAGVNYFLMVNQSRFLYGGKVSIEINKGFINDENVIDDNLLWSHLIGRKVTRLQDLANIVKVVYLGDYTQHPDLTSFTAPIQLVFAKTKYPLEIAELKSELKIERDYNNEPVSGPPLHNTFPVLRRVDEVEARLDEIMSNPDATNEEFYINDSFSIAALSLSLGYIKLFGYPFTND